jgi:hypothetical protein
MRVGDHEFAGTEDVDAELAVVDPVSRENGVRADEVLPDASASNSMGAALAGTEDGVHIDTDDPPAYMQALAGESLHDLLK